VARRRYRGGSGGGFLILFIALSALYIIQKVLIGVLTFLDYIYLKINQMSWVDWVIVTLVSSLFVYISFFLIKTYRELMNQKFEQERKRRLIRDGVESSLRTMDYRDFEYYIADLFRSKGYEAEVTPPSGDGGKDVILYKNNEVSLIECKRYNKPKVTRPDIQKFHSAMIDQGATKGYYVTTGQFTKPAIQYVANKPIELVDLSKIQDMVEELTPQLD
jgi:restriction system protein